MQFTGVVVYSYHSKFCLYRLVHHDYNAHGLRLRIASTVTSYLVIGLDLRVICIGCGGQPPAAIQLKSTYRRGIVLTIRMSGILSLHSNNRSSQRWLCGFSLDVPHSRDR
jgi:hypothetical protein